MLNTALFATSFGMGVSLPFRALRARGGGGMAALGVLGISSFFFLGTKAEFGNMARSGKVRTFSPGNIFYLLGVNSAGLLLGTAARRAGRLLR